MAEGDSESPDQKLEEILSEYRDETNKHIHPLVLAAKYNDIQAVRKYIEYYKEEGVNLEVTSNGCVRPNRPIVIAATPLWMAAACGNIDMVRFLIGQGAQVNHATKTGSTPLRGACFYGHLEVVKFLSESGGSVNQPNQWGNTPLMIAAYRKHINVVRFLLSSGVDLAAQSSYGEERGNNSLHEACAGGDLGICKLLFASGVPYCGNEHGMTPAIIAASEGMFQPMEFFLSEGVCEGDEAVNALELAGSSAVMRGHLLSSAQQVERSAPFFKRAFNILDERKDFTRDPPGPGPISPYDNIHPIRSLLELYVVLKDQQKNAMYCLLVRERVTSKQHFHTANDTRYSALLHQAKGVSKVGLELSLYNLSLNACYRSGSQCFADSLAISISFIEKEIQHFRSDTFKISHFADVALKGVKKMYEENTLDEFEDMRPEERERSIIVSVLNLLAVWGHESQESDNDWKECVAFTREFRSLPIGDTILTPLSTLLHLCSDFPIHKIREKVHQYDLLSLDNYRHIVARLLIQSGCDPNQQDGSGDTSLQVATGAISREEAPLPICHVVKELILAGVHLDARNTADRSVDWSSLERAAIEGGFLPLFNSVRILPLKCLTARAVAMLVSDKFHSLESVLPTRLSEFVEVHSRFC